MQDKYLKNSFPVLKLKDITALKIYISNTVAILRATSLADKNTGFTTKFDFR